MVEIAICVPMPCGDLEFIWEGTGRTIECHEKNQNGTTNDSGYEWW